MTILILSPLFGGETGQFSLSRYAGEAEDIISSEVAQAQKDTLKEINDGAESYLNGVLSAYGEGIYAKIVYSEDENGSYSPQNVHIYGYTGDEGSLRQSLADMTGLPPDCVIFER